VNVSECISISFCVQNISIRYSQILGEYYGRIKERVELYLYSNSGSMWPVIGELLLRRDICLSRAVRDMIYDMIYMIYMLTAIGLTPGGSCTVHIYTQTIQNDTKQTIHRTTQK
jgi:hypothetical protein